MFFSFGMPLNHIFKIVLSVSDHCDQEYLATAYPSLITSPSYPSDYDNNVDCETQLYANENQQIQLDFEVMNLEAHASCAYDYLEVRTLQTPPFAAKIRTPCPSLNDLTMNLAVILDSISDNITYKYVLCTLHVHGCAAQIDRSPKSNT